MTDGTLAGLTPGRDTPQNVHLLKVFLDYIFRMRGVPKTFRNGVQSPVPCLSVSLYVCLSVWFVCTGIK
jgi:hypothetical protein